MKTHSYHSIRIPFQQRTKPVRRKQKPIVGFDTETVYGKTRLFTAGEDDSRPIYTWEAIREFLLQKKYRKTVNGFWNLDYDFTGILKYLPKEKVVEIYHNNKTLYEQTVIRYIPKKMFSIKHNQRKAKFYDFAQFYGMMKLDTAGEKFLGEKKIDIGDKNWNEQRFLDQMEEITVYAKKDAQLTTRLGEYAKDAFSSCGIEFNDPISNAWLSSVFFRQNCYIPTINAIDRRVLRMAFDSYRGGRFECLQKGYFPHLYAHDIKSAYPHQMRSLIDFNRGNWTRTTKFDEDAYYGFYRVELIHDYRHICLTNDNFLYHLSNVSYYSHGKQTTTITQNELAYFIDNQMGDYKVLDAWVFHPTKIMYPLRLMEELYEKRQEGPMQNFAIKVVLNSLYGKMMQLKKMGPKTFKAGNLFNPIWASVITADTRLMLLKKAQKHEAEVVSFLTDCILSTKKISGKSNELGEWNYEGKGEAVVLGSGIYAIHGEDTNNKNRFRGFTSNYDLFDLCKDHADKKVASLHLNRPQTLGQSVIHVHKLDFNNMNVFTEQLRELDHDFDEKRIWEKGMNCFGDYLKNQVGSRSRKIV